MNWGIFGDKLGSLLDLGTTRPGPGVSLIAALFAEFVLTAVLLIATLLTSLVWPVRGLPSWRWLATSHSRIVWSSRADASVRPAGRCPRG